MAKIMFPDYANSVVSVSNSILRYFGAETSHKTLAELDAILNEDRRNIVYIVLDGLGSSILSETLGVDTFLARHKLRDISAVFPSTTAASGTSIQSGLTPLEHGWLGWSLYFDEIGACVDVFRNQISGSSPAKRAAEKDIARNVLRYESILERAGCETHMVSPFSEGTERYGSDFYSEAARLCALPGRKLVHVYDTQPDADLHDYGCHNARVTKTLKDIDRRIAEMCAKLEDTVVIVTADHGMTDVKMVCLDDYPEIIECLRLRPSIETRCASFFVKDGMGDEFVKRFEAAFPGKFITYTGDEFFQSGILGGGKAHSRTRSFIGDYVAIAVSDIAQCVKNEAGGFSDFKAAHAGLTEEEMKVPLIVWRFGGK